MHININDVTDTMSVAKKLVDEAEKVRGDDRGVFYLYQMAEMARTSGLAGPALAQFAFTLGCCVAEEVRKRSNEQTKRVVTS